MELVLGTLLKYIVPFFAVTSMLSVGLAHSLKSIIDPLRDIGLIVRTVLANFLFVPILAVVIHYFFNLDEAHKAGLYLLATAGGAPFLIKLTTAAGGNLAASTGILVMLLVITIVYMPLALPIALPGTSVDAGAIALSLFLTILR